MNEAVSVRSALTWAGDVATLWRRWVRAHLGMTILLSALAFVFGWLWNTYVMAVDLDGSDPDPDVRTIATAQGRPFNSLFWLLLFSLLSGLITYGWQRGWRNLFGDLAVLPRRLGQAVSRNTGGAFAVLLWGVSVSLIISTVITSAVSLALGLVLLTLSATPIGTILNFAVIRLWRALAGIVSPSAGMGAILLAGPFLVMVGEAAGLLLDWLFDTWFIGLTAGVIAAVVSILLARGAGSSPSRGSAAAILIGLMVALSALFALSALDSGRAWGDDGGWLECQTDDGQPCSELGLGGIFAWFGSEGAGVVLAHSAVGGAFAAFGTAIGVGVGSVAASLAVAGVGAAVGLAQPPPGTKATGYAKVPHQGPPHQGPPGQAGQQIPQQIPQQGGPPQGVPTEWGGQQGPSQHAAPGQVPQQGGPAHGGPAHGVPAEWSGQQGAQGQVPQQGIPQQGGPPEWGGQQIVEPPEPPQQGAGRQSVGFDEPIIPQQPTIPIDDVFPEPPDRKRDKDDGRDGRDGKDGRDTGA